MTGNPEMEQRERVRELRPKKYRVYLTRFTEEDGIDAEPIDDEDIYQEGYAVVGPDGVHVCVCYNEADAYRIAVLLDNYRREED